jgi:hypothetical protein
LKSFWESEVNSRETDKVLVERAKRIEECSWDQWKPARDIQPTLAELHPAPNPLEKEHGKTVVHQR